MTSGCLDRKEVRGAIWGVHSTTDRPAGGNTGRLFLVFGPISNCPLDRVLTYKNLIYLLNLQFPPLPKICGSLYLHVNLSVFVNSYFISVPSLPKVYCSLSPNSVNSILTGMN